MNLFAAKQPTCKKQNSKMKPIHSTVNEREILETRRRKLTATGTHTCRNQYYDASYPSKQTT
jgi:hypothetical protein